MSKEPKEQAAKPAVFLLDNHMVQYFLSKDISPHIQFILDEIEKTGSELAISQVVVYESLKAIIFNEDKFNDVKDFLENSIIRYPVSEEVLLESARVHELYGSDNDAKNRRNGISTEDIIIATTSMLLGSYVITCDANDFPMPFFKEVHREFVYYERKSQRKHLVIYILQPDTEAVEAGLNKLSPPKMTKKKAKTKAKAKK